MATIAKKTASPKREATPQTVDNVSVAVRKGSSTPAWTRPMRLDDPSAGSTPRRQQVLGALVRLLQRLKLPSWSFHQLRHFFCSTLVRRGASVEAVRLLAGHSKLDVTQRYVHAVAGDLQSAIARLS